MENFHWKYCLRDRLTIKVFLVNSDNFMENFVKMTFLSDNYLRSLENFYQKDRNLVNLARYRTSLTPLFIKEETRDLLLFFKRGLPLKVTQKLRNAGEYCATILNMVSAADKKAQIPWQEEVKVHKRNFWMVPKFWINGRCL